MKIGNREIHIGDQVRVMCACSSCIRRNLTGNVFEVISLYDNSCRINDIDQTYFEAELLEYVPS